MIFYKFLVFFISKLSFKDLIKIFINYLLIFFLILFDIAFVIVIFLIFNPSNFKDSGFLSNFINDKIYIYSDIYNVEILSFKLILLVFFLISKNLIYVLQNWFLYSYLYLLSAKISKNILKNFLRDNYQNFINKNISTYTKIITKDIDNVFSGIYQSIITIIGDLIYIIILIFYSLKLVEIKIFSEHLFLILILTFLLIFNWKKNITLGILRNNYETKIFEKLNEIFLAIKEIKVFNKINFFTNSFYKYSKNFYKIRIYSGVINILPKIFFEISAFIFLVISYFNFDGKINEFISSITILAFVFMRILPPLNKISQNFNSCLYFNESLKLIEKTYNKTNKEQTSKFSELRKISLKDISYSHLKNKRKIQIINNFNLDLVPGKIYGILGKSGRGKTTLLNIICGLIKPDSGKILINNKFVTLDNIYNKYRVGIVNQEPYILDGSVYENITLNFKKNIKIDYEDKQKIKKLLNYFNLKKYSNERNLNNNSLSLNKKLSGGEKQRISLIRSIYFDPDLLILDEPSAALDKINENKLIKFLQKYKKNKIIILTSHKETLKKVIDKTIKL